VHSRNAKNMCVSQSSSEDLIRFGPKMSAPAIFHVPNAFDPSIFEEADSINVANGTTMLRSLGVSLPFMLGENLFFEFDNVANTLTRVSDHWKWQSLQEFKIVR